MDFIGCKPNHELLIMKETIEKYLLEKDYENAFALFLIYIARLNSFDRDDLILYFKNYFMYKSKNNIKK